MKLSMMINDMIITIGARNCPNADRGDKKCSYELAFSVVKDKELCFEKKISPFKEEDLDSIMAVCKGLTSGSDQEMEVEFANEGLTVTSCPERKLLRVIVIGSGGESPVTSMTLMMIPQEFVPDIYELLMGVTSGLAIYECDFELPPGSAVYEDKMNFNAANELYGANYSEFGFVYPCCNHKEGLSKCNVGYSQGALDGNIPFEIELVREVDKSYVCVMIPRDYVYCSEDFVPDIEKVPDIQKAILPIGLKYEGCIDNDHYSTNCCGMLSDYGIISFLADTYIANIEWYTDKNGTELTMVEIVLEQEGKEYARTDIEFRSYDDFTLVNPPMGKSEDGPIPGALINKSRES